MAHWTRLFALSLGVGGLLAMAIPSIAQEPAVTAVPGKRWTELEALRYTPKMSPDTITDYRPAIASRIAGIPEAGIATLPKLVRMLQSYNEAASRSPGRWVPGFVYLGANPKEYRPSDVELMASEVGDRIYAFVSKASLGEVVNTLKAAGIDVASISYPRFEIRHADVMGTGRYFYCSPPRMIKIVLQGGAILPSAEQARR